jgi:putative SOS response-associated peptidase YedK
MCGRYYRRSDKQKIAEAFHVSQVDDFALPPWDYNVAPTSMQPIVRHNRDTGERELVSLRWGLVPFFSKSLADVKGISTINARAETTVN